MTQYPLKHPLERAASIGLDICPDCGGQLDDAWNCDTCHRHNPPVVNAPTKEDEDNGET